MDAPLKNEETPRYPIAQTLRFRISIDWDTSFAVKMAPLGHTNAPSTPQPSTVRSFHLSAVHCLQHINRLVKQGSKSLTTYHKQKYLGCPQLHL
jgi:hypothetical protein